MQSPGESSACNDSYLLALTQPGVTLKAWNPSTLDGQDTGPSTGHFQAAPDMHDQESVVFMADGQVLEGQGRGQVLGPPAQRWAAASALKDDSNRSALPHTWQSVTWMHDSYADIIASNPAIDQSSADKSCSLDCAVGNSIKLHIILQSGESLHSVFTLAVCLGCKCSIACQSLHDNCVWRFVHHQS